MSTISYKASELSQPERFKYLVGAVGPRPICFASTVDKEGRVNLSPYSFFNAFSSSPPIMIFSPARNRDGNQKHTYLNVKEVPEVVINVVNYPMVQQQSLASTAYDRGVNEFIKSGLTQVASDQVRPPRVGEAPAAFECKVLDVKDFGENPGAGSLIICEVLVIHLQDQYLDDNGFPDSTKLDLVGRLGANWYTRASGDALFEIRKPTRIKGIGIDQLPSSIKESRILTGNELAKLGGLEKLPSRDEAESMLSELDLEGIIGEDGAHRKAQELLKENKRDIALALLMYR